MDHEKFRKELVKDLVGIGLRKLVPPERDPEAWKNAWRKDWTSECT